MTRPFSPLPFALGLLSLAAESLRALPGAWHRLSLRRAWEQTRDWRDENRRERDRDPARDPADGGEALPDSRREVWDGETVRMVGEMGVTVGGE